MFALARNVSVPLLATAGAVVNSAGSSSAAIENTGVCTSASSGPPTEIAFAHPGRVCGPASSATVTSGPTVNDGGSSTAPTVTVTLRVTVPP